MPALANRAWSQTGLENSNPEPTRIVPATSETLPSEARIGDVRNNNYPNPKPRAEPLWEQVYLQTSANPDILIIDRATLNNILRTDG